jgi:hypothetical protein
VLQAGKKLDDRAAVDFSECTDSRAPEHLNEERPYRNIY